LRGGVKGEISLSVNTNWVATISYTTPTPLGLEGKQCAAVRRQQRRGAGGRRLQSRTVSGMPIWRRCIPAAHAAATSGLADAERMIRIDVVTALADLAPETLDQPQRLPGVRCADDLRDQLGDAGLFVDDGQFATRRPNEKRGSDANCVIIEKTTTARSNERP